MICQNCHKRVANVHFSQLQNNTKVEFHLCTQCANEKGYVNIIEPINISDFLSSLLGYGAQGKIEIAKPEEKQCSVCGMTYENFQKTGKLGCYNCYSLFGDKLAPVLKNIHGSLIHNGKIPQTLSKKVKLSRETHKLQEQLEHAVRNEEYERAAEIRDKIKQLGEQNI